MSSVAVLARPYARAAFEIAQADGALAQWSEQLALASAIITHADVTAALHNPRVERQQLADVVVEAGGTVFTEGFSNLLRLMAHNRRLALLPEVLLGFEALRAQAEERLPVTIRSATTLTADQRNNLEDKLVTRFGRKVEARYELDEQLIGGAVIEAGDIIIDGSLRNKLERLRGALHKG